MKKLMLAAVAIAFAVVANAAAVNWNSGTIFIASDATGTPGSGTTYRANGSARLVNAYLYSLTEAEYTTALTMSTADLYNQYKSTTPTKSAASGAMGTANIKQDGLADGSAEAPQTAYGLILYVDEKTAANYDNVDVFVKSYVGSVSWQDTIGGGLSNLAASQGSWTAVPEPTSGLLMLLGMAGLALRRRRV